MPRGGGTRRNRIVRHALFIALFAVAATAAVFFIPLPSAEPLRRQNPATTALIEARARQAREKGWAARRMQRWLPLSRVSPWLQRVVVNSEDARFWEHDGVDPVETEEALRKAIDRGKLGGGASTITQQLAKNLWLNEDRSLWRKAKELILACRLEALGKRRILE